MSDNFDNSSEIIFFLPKSQYRWSYRIDDGKQYIIKQEDIIPYCKKYISIIELKKINDILMRHVPFIVLIEDKKVVEITKEEDTYEEQRKKIKIEIKNIEKFGVNLNLEKNKESDLNFNQLINKFSKM